MIYLVVGLIFGIICAIIASGKQRNPIGWFLIGFFLPLIGLILIIVLPKGEGSGGIHVPPDLHVPEPAAPMAAAAGGAADASLEALQKLADLRDRGAITDEEFETKKRELLARV